MTQAHVDNPPTPLIESKHNVNSDKYFIKLKLCRYPTSATSGLYEFNMALFDNGESEEFLLLVRDFIITLAMSGKLEMGAKIQYLCDILHGKVLHNFYSLPNDVKIMNPLTVENIILGLASYFFL